MPAKRRDIKYRVLSVDDGDNDLQLTTTVAGSNKMFAFAMIIVVCVFVAFVGYFSVINWNSNMLHSNQKLLIIMIDGVRHDYIDRDATLKGFKKIQQEGVRAQYMEPVFPSNTYPNWYTIATGLYPESHGILDNYMYDDEKNDYFLMSPHPNASHDHWWNKAEPIWVTAEKAGKKVSMFNWDACHVEIKDTLPTRCFQYRTIKGWDNVNSDTSSAMNQILDGFQSDKFTLSMLYYEGVDHNGHDHGPESEIVKQTVRNIDAILYELLENIERRGLKNINIYITSDHGMTQPTEHIELKNYLNYGDIKIALGSNAFGMIRAVDESAENRIYAAMKNMSSLGIRVFRKNEIPDEMGIKHNILTLPLVFYTKPGVVFTHKEVYDMKGHAGVHGFYAKETKDMRGITLAIGPAFKNGYLNVPVKQIDHYQVFCKILGLTPNSHNGSWSRVMSMFKV